MKKLASAFALLALVPACTTDENGTGPTANADASVALDGSIAIDAGHDAANADGASTHDASDANVADTNVADTNVADTNVADTNVADTSVTDAGPPDATTEDAGDAAAGTVSSSGAAATQLDLVGKSDQALTPDGETDGTIDAHLVGPITALVLLTTDASGAAAGGQEWDTLVGNDVIPGATLGSGFTSGSQTWILGVFQGTTALNAADGRLALGAGGYHVTLVASDSGHFVSGQYFRLWARDSGGNWSGGPVFLWP